MEQLGPADPRQVGPYALVGRLGAGGMGAVYLGRSAGGRTVAVKVVRPELAGDPGFRARFRQEVAAARRVSGAFTAPVVDADPEAVTPWMATAFVVGVPLQDAVVRHGPLPEGTVRTLAAGLAEALHEVHRAGLIHRDLKPGNVLLALDGPHVIDFGISRAADGTGLTTTGSVIGSAPYMSPEQALGEPLAPASDVFALGSTVAYAALGRHLFGEGAGAAVLFRVVNTEPDLSGLPDGLRYLVGACLAKNPVHRPAPRQLVELVERIGRPDTAGGWLPQAVTADVLAVRGVLTAAPEPSERPESPEPPESPAYPPPAYPPPAYTPPPSDAPPRQPPRRRLPRRRVLLAIGGGVLTAAGAATTVALLREQDVHEQDVRDVHAPPGAAATTGATTTRPAVAAVPEASLAWKVNLPSACPQLLSAPGVTACIGLGHIWGVDDAGHTKWTADAGYAMGGMPRNFSALGGDRLYTVGMAMVGVASRSELVSVNPADGSIDWRLQQDHPHAVGELLFAGVRAGRAYLIGLGDGADRGIADTGFHVWAVDLAGRRTAWLHGDQAQLLELALLPGDDHAALSTQDTLKMLDAKGEVAWERRMPSLGLTAAGGHYLVPDAVRGTLTALDPATGNPTWTTDGVIGASLRGDGFAASADGGTVHCLMKDADGGVSVAALDTGNGRPRHRTPLPPDPPDAAYLGARLLLADGNLYRMGPDTVLWALDPADGKPRWKYSGLKGKDPTTLAWTAGDGRLCVSDPSTSTVTALHANGA
ncbi:PQQ-binding-like beta-propeller repeat protein [Kitasatospora sp. NPDC059408]|uniref:serine/threonine-protein kinase n=1 Tax=Kitasatospora sp. NPDC059408 TaxID=3346823 RepID=UPI0036B47CE8